MATEDDGRETTVTLEALGGFRFRADFEASGTELVMDEPEPLGEGTGPAASEVLSAAVGNCLSASLLFCLRKGDIEPEGLRTVVETRVGRNEDGRLRVESSDVTLRLELAPEDRARAARCLEVFEDYCVVTGAVRQGLEVDVAVEDRDGTPLASGEAGSGR
jgi:organic hydroperoxide reductase OsmC/OhrA